MTKSIWQSQIQLPEFPELRGEIHTDVLVIGGGMAGLLTAYCLKQKGIDSVVVEKDRVCSGTTAGTTAKITAQHGFCYQKILNTYSETYASMYYTANSLAVKQLKDLCRQADCAAESKTNFVYSQDPRKVEAELRALQRFGADPLYQDRLPVPVENIEAVGLKNQGQFNPLGLVQFLIRPLTIYENTKVTQLIGTTAVTPSGKINAKKVIIATHFPFLNKHGSYFLKLYQHRSYLLALENAPMLNAMYVDEKKTGFSFSRFGDYLLLGGGGHRTGKKGGSYGALRAFAQQHYPNAREVWHWAAQDTMSLDGIPYIGNYSRNTPDLYVAAGFNKWGMTSSMVSADLLSTMIAGETPEYAPVFSPSRSILRPQLAVNIFETATNFFYPTTRRCPHLGCALKYNKEERSWDCSCHGSRFSETGTVLNNPANDDLNKQNGRQ